MRAKIRWQDYDDGRQVFVEDRIHDCLASALEDAWNEGFGWREVHAAEPVDVVHSAHQLVEDFAAGVELDCDGNSPADFAFIGTDDYAALDAALDAIRSRMEWYEGGAEIDLTGHPYIAEMEAEEARDGE